MADQTPPRSTISFRKIAPFRRPTEFRAHANVSDEGVYAEAERDPEAFWARVRRASSSGHAVDDACSTGSRRTRSGSSAARSTPASTASTATCAAPRRNKAALIWEGEPGDRRTLTYFDLLPRGVAVRQRAEVARRRRRATASPSTCRSFPSWRSRCSPARASAPCTASCSAASAPSRCAIASTTRRRAAHHRRRRLPPRPDRAAQAGRRRGARRHAVDRARRRRPARRRRADPGHMKEGRDHWYHELMQDAPLTLRARADGRRGHALHPLHVRHDREAEGHRPHDRRLSRRHLRDDEAGSSISRTTTSTGAPPTSAG